MLYLYISSRKRKNVITGVNNMEDNLKESFREFIRQIPKDDYSRCKAFISRNIAVFEPDCYIFNKKLCMEDYQFILHFTAPPPVKVGEKEYEFKKGCLTIIGSETELTVLSGNNNSRPRYISVCIKKSFLENIALEMTGKAEVKLKKIDNAYSQQLLDFIKGYEYELLKFGSNFPVMVQSFETQICCQLLREIYSDYACKRQENYKDMDYINKAIDYMRSYYSSNATIQDISNAVYLSSNHFMRLFKEQTGLTPHEYLINIRLEKAKEMLSNHEYFIEDVARLCGFVNPGHFSTLFKRSTGITPTEYRKRL